MLRVHKVLTAVPDAEIVSANALANDIRGILLPEDHERYLKELSIDASYTLTDGSRFRVNAYFEKGSPALAARYIPAHIPSLDDLEVPAVVHDFIQLGQGIVLVTGPAGSGKSTLLAAMLEEINATRKEHILTFEDPIEFLFSPKQSIISQLQLGRDFPNFQSALKHALRQDPNIILIGEMRDLETMQAALTLAETGHLVFATLHTNSAPQTIERVVNAFPPYQQTQVRLQLALSLRGVISQLLLPTPDGGLLAAREVLINNSAIAHLIIEAKTEQIPNVLMTSGDQGMRTMDQELQELVDQGMVAPDTAMKYSRHPEKFGGEAIE
jgi:twitching motility protein PilT